MKIFKKFLVLSMVFGLAASVWAQTSAADEFDNYRTLGRTKPTTTNSNPTPTNGGKTNGGKTNGGKTQPTTVTSQKTSVGLPGMKIWLQKQVACKNGFITVLPKTVFQSGDCIRLEFKLNFEGYLTVINLGTTGANEIIYPLDNQNNKILPKINYRIPDDEGWFFDENPGSEQFIFIVSRNEINQEVIQNYLSKKGLVTEKSPDIEVYDNRDIKPRTEKKEVYVLADEEKLEKPLIFRMSVKHK